jgi:hypothetical protein
MWPRVWNQTNKYLRPSGKGTLGRTLPGVPVLESEPRLELEPEPQPQPEPEQELEQEP